MKLIKKIDLQTWLIIAIMLAAAFVRFYHYTGFSLSNDELSALVRVQYNTFAELVEKGFFVDGHPGGIQVLLFYWVKVFGDSETSLRLPFVVMGTLAVWFTYLTAKLWFGKTSALFIAACVAFLQFPLLYSQIARPYGSGLFFTMLTTYFWTRLIFHSESKSTGKYLDTAGYTLATSLMMYNHYFSFLLAFVIGITGLFMLRRENMWYYLAAGLVCVLFFVPHIPVTLNHLSIGGVGLWLGKPGQSWLFQHIVYIFNDSYWLLLIVVLLALTGYLSSKKADKETRRLRLIAVIWFLIPIITGFIYSIRVNPVLQDSVVIFSFPFLLFALFSFPFWQTDKVRTAMLMALIMALIASTFVENKYYSKQHFGEFRGVAAKVVEWDKTYGPGNITRAISVNNPFYIEYYLKRHKADPEFTLYDNRWDGRDLFELKGILQRSETPYFLYAWTKMVPYETQDLIRYYYPFILHHVDYGGLSAVTLFSVCATGSLEDPVAAFRMQNDFNPAQLWHAPAWALDTSEVFSGKYSIKMSEALEFGPTFSAPAGDARVTEGSVVKTRIMVKTEQESSTALLVMTLEQWDTPVYLWVASPVSNYAVPGRWSPVFLTVPVKQLKSTRDIMKIYLWNPGKEQFFVDEMQVEVFHNMAPRL